MNPTRLIAGIRFGPGEDYFFHRRPSFIVASQTRFRLRMPSLHRDGATLP